MPEDRVPLFVRLPRQQSAALDELVSTTGRRKQHLVTEMLADQLAVGRIEMSRDGGVEEVLTLDEAAALLRVPTEAVRVRVTDGALPGRAFGGEWRFSRAKLLAWLADGEPAPHEAEPSTKSDDG